jgi:hypothetical protein
MDRHLAMPLALPAMIRRRSTYDPLEPTREARWYVVRNMHGATLEARRLPIGTHLKREFIAAILTWIDAGWEIGEFSSRAGVFAVQRGTERRMVTIQPVDPHEDSGGEGAAHLAAP